MELATGIRFDGTTPKVARRYLCTLWAQICAKLHRLNIGVYGLRVVEPNHDGTPRWHLLLFMEKRHRERVRSVFKGYCTRSDGEEAGADKHRFQAVAIDWTKGTAAGYVAKYVAKNIDGFGMETDEEGNDAATAAERVSTWASSGGIRQFQLIGGPPVSLWRELRNLTPAPV